MNKAFLPLLFVFSTFLYACTNKPSLQPTSNKEASDAAAREAKPDKPALPPGVEARFYLTAPGTAEPIKTRTIRHPQTGEYRHITDPPIADTHDISQIAKTKDALGKTALTFTFKPEAAKRMLVKTESHVGQVLVITVDGEFLVATIIRAPLGRNITIRSDSLYNAKTKALFEKLME